jgi:hypothetical protein
MPTENALEADWNSSASPPPAYHKLPQWRVEPWNISRASGEAPIRPMPSTTTSVSVTMSEIRAVPDAPDLPRRISAGQTVGGGSGAISRWK